MKTAVWFGEQSQQTQLIEAAIKQRMLSPDLSHLILICLNPHISQHISYLYITKTY